MPTSSGPETSAYRALPLVPQPPGISGPLTMKGEDRELKSLSPVNPGYKTGKMIESGSFSIPESRLLGDHEVTTFSPARATPAAEQPERNSPTALSDSRRRESGNTDLAFRIQVVAPNPDTLQGAGQEISVSLLFFDADGLYSAPVLRAGPLFSDIPAQFDGRDSSNESLREKVYFLSR